jgi:hypothetical protein
LAATGALAGTGVPQLVQKRVFGESLLPQPVQKAVVDGAAAAAIGFPQVVQNFEDPLTSLPHDEQTAIRNSCQILFSGAEAPDSLRARLTGG